MIFILKIQSNNELFTTLESMGDFFLVPRTNNIILRTPLSRTKVSNKIKKISDSFDISLIEDKDISNYPDIIKTWYGLDKLEQKINSIDKKEVEKEALYKLNSFVDALEKELKDSAGKEVINCRTK